MKIFLMSIVSLLLWSCASTSEVKDIEQLVMESRHSVAELDNKIDELEVDRTKLTEQLKAIDGNGKSEARELKNKISKIDQSIDSYKNKIKTINANLTKNTENITAVRKQQKSQHEAASVAVKENQELIKQANDEIQALELEYEEKRRKAKEQRDNEENDGE